MYIPPAFKQPDIDKLRALMSNHPFATLVVQGEHSLVANHLPLLWRDDGSPFGRLVGHVARANPLWQMLPTLPVLAIFHGPDHYVSPNWYPSKAENGRVVPTWNYSVVHASGSLQINEDVGWLLGLLNELTHRHEATEATPWTVADAPTEFIESLVKGIVGIEIPLDSLSGKWKLSQNQPERNQQGVVGALEEKGGLAASVASTMRDTLNL